MAGEVCGDRVEEICGEGVGGICGETVGETGDGRGAEVCGEIGEVCGGIEEVCGGIGDVFGLVAETCGGKEDAAGAAVLLAVVGTGRPGRSIKESQNMVAEVRINATAKTPRQYKMPLSQIAIWLPRKANNYNPPR